MREYGLKAFSYQVTHVKRRYGNETMENSKLTTPLFYNGPHNQDDRRIRAAYEMRGRSPTEQTATGSGAGREAGFGLHQCNAG